MRHRSEHRRAERPLVAALYQRRINGRRQIRRQAARGGAQHMIDRELQNHRNGYRESQRPVIPQRAAVGPSSIRRLSFPEDLTQTRIELAPAPLPRGPIGESASVVAYPHLPPAIGQHRPYRLPYRSRVRWIFTLNLLIYNGGRYWDRTSGPCRVKAVLYR